MAASAHDLIPTNTSEYPCIELVNSAFTDYLGRAQPVDRLPSMEWQAWFLQHHDLKPETHGAVPVARLAVLRSDIRGVLERWAANGRPTRRDGRALDGWVSAGLVRQRVAVRAHGVDVFLEPVSRDWKWVMATIASSAARLIADGDPHRLKVCSNPNCSWMYYDTSRNASRRHCSSSPCGTLMRVRRFRASLG